MPQSAPQQRIQDLRDRPTKQQFGSEQVQPVPETGDNRPFIRRLIPALAGAGLGTIAGGPIGGIAGGIGGFFAGNSANKGIDQRTLRAQQAFNDYAQRNNQTLGGINQGFQQVNDLNAVYSTGGAERIRPLPLGTSASVAQDFSQQVEDFSNRAQPFFDSYRNLPEYDRRAQAGQIPNVLPPLATSTPTTPTAGQPTNPLPGQPSSSETLPPLQGGVSVSDPEVQQPFRQPTREELLSTTLTPEQADKAATQSRLRAQQPFEIARIQAQTEQAQTQAGLNTERIQLTQQETQFYARAKEAEIASLLARAERDNRPNATTILNTTADGLYETGRISTEDYQAMKLTAGGGLGQPTEIKIWGPDYSQRMVMPSDVTIQGQVIPAGAEVPIFNNQFIVPKEGQHFTRQVIGKTRATRADEDVTGTAPAGRTGLQRRGL